MNGALGWWANLRVYCDRKKPFLHSRIVTVSLLTVTSVMITWSEWLLFGSQSRGGAGFGDVGICGNRLTILKSFAILLLFTFSIVFSTRLLWTVSWLFSGLIDLNASSWESTGWFALAVCWETAIIQNWCQKKGKYVVSITIKLHFTPARRWRMLCYLVAMMLTVFPAVY